MKHHFQPILTPHHWFNRRAVAIHLAVLGLSAAGALTSPGAANAADSTSNDARSRYVKERAICLAGASNQDRATCLEEAGAALQASRRGSLDDSSFNQQAQNSEARCDALPAGDRQDCIRRMRGEGVVSGTAADGGIYREITTPVPPR